MIILTIILIPLISEVQTLNEIICILTQPTHLITIVQLCVMTGLLFGLLNALIAWATRRNKERTETDQLMREYLKKKLREEKENAE